MSSFLPLLSLLSGITFYVGNYFPLIMQIYSIIFWHLICWLKVCLGCNCHSLEIIYIFWYHLRFFFLNFWIFWYFPTVPKNNDFLHLSWHSVGTSDEKTHVFLQLQTFLGSWNSSKFFSSIDYVPFPPFSTENSY